MKYWKTEFIINLFKNDEFHLNVYDTFLLIVECKQTKRMIYFRRIKTIEYYNLFLIVVL